MEVSAAALQQSKTDVGLSMLKKNAQAEQALVNVIEKSIQSAPGGSRGQNLNITV